MSAVTNIRAATRPLPDIVGYVEAVTADRLLGWAWSPATPDLRASIELRLNDTTVARTTADLPRPDLAANGIGDGRHAFEITIPPEYAARAAELRIFAQAGEGAATPIGATPVAEGLSDQVGKVLRGLDMLLNSQRLIHHNLQSALNSKGQDTEGQVPAVLTGIAEMQSATLEQLGMLEKFIVRLDEHFSTAPASAHATARIPKAALIALGLSGLALIVSAYGLLRSLVG